MSDAQGRFTIKVKAGATVETSVSLNGAASPKERGQTAKVGSPVQDAGVVVYPFDVKSTITLGGTVDIVDHSTLDVTGGNPDILAMDFRIPFTTTGVQLETGYIPNAGRATWVITMDGTALPGTDVHVWNSHYDGNKQPYVHRTDDGSRLSAGAAEFNATFILDKSTRDTRTVRFTAVMDILQLNVTTGLYVPVRSNPVQFTVTLQRKPTVFGGVTILPPLTGDPELTYEQALTFCPSGYRLPTVAELDAAWASWKDGQNWATRGTWTSTPYVKLMPENYTEHYGFVAYWAGWNGAGRIDDDLSTLHVVDHPVDLQGNRYPRDTYYYSKKVQVTCVKS